MEHSEDQKFVTCVTCQRSSATSAYLYGSDPGLPEYWTCAAPDVALKVDHVDPVSGREIFLDGAGLHQGHSQPLCGCINMDGLCRYWQEAGWLQERRGKEWAEELGLRQPPPSPVVHYPAAHPRTALSFIAELHKAFRVLLWRD